jgi:uncharacterized protein (DUF1697 family)
MNTWIGLFRGINVGGNNILKMAELRSDLQSLKLANVKSYIQSGNVIFDSSAKTPASLQKKIGSFIEKKHGFRPHLLIMSCEELEAAIQSNPFPKAVSDPKSLHFFFLAEPPQAPDTKALNTAKSATEKFQLMDKVFYLHAPQGIGKSKLAANAEKHLGVATTARNYRTVSKLMDMVSPS